MDLGKKENVTGSIWVALGEKKKIGQKQRAYNVLEMEEHLSLGSGAGSDLLKTPASKDTSPETRQKDVLHLKRSFPHSGYADVSFWGLETAFPRDSQATQGLCLSLPFQPLRKGETGKNSAGGAETWFEEARGRRFESRHPWGVGLKGDSTEGVKGEGAWEHQAGDQRRTHRPRQGAVWAPAEKGGWRRDAWGGVEGKLSLRRRALGGGRRGGSSGRAACDRRGCGGWNR